MSPCNMLAVVTGTLQHNVIADALAIPTVVEAVQVLMAAQLGVDRSAVTMFNSDIHGAEHSWWAGYNAWRTQQPIPVNDPAALVGSTEMYWVTDRIAVKVGAEGVTFRDGWNLHQPLRGDALNAFATEMEALLNQLGVALAQEKTVEVLSQVGQITEDTWQHMTGARVLKVSIDL